jgi:hypothetical protein
LPQTVRGGRDKSIAGHATPGDPMAAAHDAIPDGFVREIRMPEGNGNAQTRMGRPGDFRIRGITLFMFRANRGRHRRWIVMRNDRA